MEIYKSQLVYENATLKKITISLLSKNIDRQRTALSSTLAVFFTLYNTRKLNLFEN